LLLDGDGRTIHVEQDTPPAWRMERRHEFFTSPRLQGEVGMSACFALIPGEGTSPATGEGSSLFQAMMPSFESGSDSAPPVRRRGPL